MTKNAKQWWDGKIVKFNTTESDEKNPILGAKKASYLAEAMFSQANPDPSANKTARLLTDDDHEKLKGMKYAEHKTYTAVQRSLSDTGQWIMEPKLKSDGTPVLNSHGNPMQTTKKEEGTSTDIELGINKVDGRTYVDFRKHGLLSKGKLVGVMLEYTQADLDSSDKGRAKHFSAANQLWGLGGDAKSEHQVIDGVKYTWHHVEGLTIKDGKVYGMMILVRSDVHKAGHDGGIEEAPLKLKEAAKAARS